MCGVDCFADLVVKQLKKGEVMDGSEACEM